MTRWAMVADLERCVGCQTCTAACKHANATSPAVQWRKVLDIESGAYPDVTRTFVPVGCQHCDEPPCLDACPSSATRRRPDGIVTIDYDLCIGCAYCDVACPYQARFKVAEPRYAFVGRGMPHEIERSDLDRIGVAQKCTFCAERIDFGLAAGLVPGRDPRATPACANACIAEALHFGDLDDPNSNVSRLLREHKHFRMHEELGTGPGFIYLYGKNDDAAAAAPADNAPVSRADGLAGSIRAKGVEPAHQQHWDWKAAGNFLCGGAGAGLYLFQALASLAGFPVLPLSMLATALIALGLFLVLLKIGRPWRCINVLRRPQRSWMSREAWIAGAFFPLAVFAAWRDDAGLTIAAALAALLFLTSQAMILKDAKAIPTWRVTALAPLMIVTALVEGGGLFLAAAAVFPGLEPAAQTTAIAVAALAAARAVAWWRYLAALSDAGAPLRSLDILTAARPWMLGLGLLVPVALIVIGSLADGAAAVVFAAAGIVAATAGWLLKFTLITRAGFNQGFALKHTPVRGAGRPGGAVKPGWSPLVGTPNNFL